ncbi:eukaryotic peptide chain release factor subunit [Chytridium lagenaria]|nr:eukaryotic peptide chain release factor subunit [Chytridium lagenaria]
MSDLNDDVEMWKMKQFIKRLEEAKGNGTSMISLFLKPRDQISQATHMLTEEFGVAANIKSRVNRLSVQSAITSTREKLKTYSKVPPNGLVLFCGTITTPENKPRLINISFEPPKPLPHSLYHCDSKFHTETLHTLIQLTPTLSFIIIDGRGCLFATLSGSHRRILHKFSVHLPKKHGRGGQSASRFARLREIARHNYIKKVAELAGLLLNPDTGLIVAGSADLKNEIVEMWWGGILLAFWMRLRWLENWRRKLLGGFFDEIAQDTGKYCFGVEDTFKALELGAVESLVVWDSLKIQRYDLQTTTGERIIKHLSEVQESQRESFADASGTEMEIMGKTLLLEWLSERFKDFGTSLELVSDQSQEGMQFCRGFGGIGGILRYNVHFGTPNDEEEYLSDDSE